MKDVKNQKESLNFLFFYFYYMLNYAIIFLWEKFQDEQRIIANGIDYSQVIWSDLIIWMMRFIFIKTHLLDEENVYALKIVSFTKITIVFINMKNSFKWICIYRKDIPSKMHLYHKKKWTILMYIWRCFVTHLFKLSDLFYEKKELNISR